MSEAWQDKANCKGEDTSIFFPEIPTGDVRTFYWLKAREFCDACTVRVQCLKFQLPFEAETKRRDGMWGGLTPKEREEFVRRPQSVEWK